MRKKCVVGISQFMFYVSINLKTEKKRINDHVG